MVLYFRFIKQIICWNHEAAAQVTISKALMTVVITE